MRDFVSVRTVLGGSAHAPASRAVGAGPAALTHAARISQARQRSMAAQLVTPRGQIADRQNPQARQQAPRLDAKRRAKIVEAENIRLPGKCTAAGFEPVSDLDEVAAALAVFRVHVSQVASNRVFQNGQQEFEFTLDNLISPDQIDVLSRQQQSGLDSFFVRHQMSPMTGAKARPRETTVRPITNLPDHCFDNMNSEGGDDSTK